MNKNIVSISPLEELKILLSLSIKDVLVDPKIHQTYYQNHQMSLLENWKERNIGVIKQQSQEKILKNEGSDMSHIGCLWLVDQWSELGNMASAAALQTIPWLSRYVSYQNPEDVLFLLEKTHEVFRKTKHIDQVLSQNLSAVHVIRVLDPVVQTNIQDPTHHTMFYDVLDELLCHAPAASAQLLEKMPLSLVRKSFHEFQKRKSGSSQIIDEFYLNTLLGGVMKGVSKNKKEFMDEFLKVSPLCSVPEKLKVFYRPSALNVEGSALLLNSLSALPSHWPQSIKDQLIVPDKTLHQAMNAAWKNSSLLKDNKSHGKLMEALISFPYDRHPQDSLRTDIQASLHKMALYTCIGTLSKSTINLTHRLWTSAKPLLQSAENLIKFDFNDWQSYKDDSKCISLNLSENTKNSMVGYFNSQPFQNFFNDLPPSLQATIQLVYHAKTQGVASPSHQALDCVAKKSTSLTQKQWNVFLEKHELDMQVQSSLASKDDLIKKRKI